jgi:hypothetical protein
MWSPTYHGLLQTAKTAMICRLLAHLIETVEFNDEHVYSVGLWSQGLPNLRVRTQARVNVGPAA